MFMSAIDLAILVFCDLVHFWHRFRACLKSRSVDFLSEALKQLSLKLCYINLLHGLRPLFHNMDS